VSERAKVGLALFATYTIWGSTYLGMKFARDSFPPLLMAFMRFGLAGSLMFVFALFEGKKLPTRREFLGGMGIGMILLGLGNGGVVLGLGYISTSLTALILASSPIWAALFAGFWGEWPSRREIIGLMIGFLGAAVLSLDGHVQASPRGFVLLIVAAMGWALGTVLIPKVAQASGMMGSAVQMMGASTVLLMGGLATGESLTQMPTATSLYAFAYLVIFGSLIGYTAYSYLVPRVRPSLAISSSYVNPMIAVLLGFFINNETISPHMMAALPLIIGGVLLMARAKTQKPATVQADVATV